MHGQGILWEISEIAFEGKILCRVEILIALEFKSLLVFLKDPLGIM